MKILHASDLHLQEENERTIDALREVLSVGRENEVDLVTIGGDLFHSREDAEVLRPQLREIFTDNPFKVLAIPGNHDEGAYRGNLNWGPDLEVATEKPFEIREFEDQNIVALPADSVHLKSIKIVLGVKSVKKPPLDNLRSFIHLE
ncbi:hypothetical protein AKJ51_00430 [candidate division MSBL1 archaeon SCGC-AAA382A20]|uniref:Calcineurin-like phosphoesterase domain-containing protein n=1 Tax=candidate division MSBL1 archaeon SCGC-AAA382A20 TaxID=1698280 RepID=A0A133VMP5_9EURY|nr:hypothetical protein AKJ51_00430 [candidate division MSBL1 archaeon SCGC-AAA382A20]